MSPFFAYFSVVFLLFSETQGLKCYICISGRDAHCERNPPPVEYLQECSLKTYKNRMPNVTESPEGFFPTTMTAGNGSPATPPTTQQDNVPLNNRTSRSAQSKLMEHSAFEVFSPQPTSDNDFTFCRKNVYRIPKQKNGKDITSDETIRILRSCGWILNKEAKTPKVGCKRIRDQIGKHKTSKGATTDECVCTGDKCNSGNYSASFTSSLAIILIIIQTYASVALSWF